MEKRKFNVMDVLGEQLAGVAELNTSGPEQIEYIDIGLLDGDERNFYQLTDIDELADNIQMCGLQQPIWVRPVRADGSPSSAATVAGPPWLSLWKRDWISSAGCPASGRKTMSPRRFRSSG